MPFELWKTINGGAEWVCGSSAIFGILRNPVLTALLITALALIIIFTLYRDNLRKGGLRLGIKTSFWLLVAVSAVVFVHYYALERSLKQTHAQQGLRDTIASIHHSAAAAATTGGGYQVYPGAPRGFGDESPAVPAVPAVPGPDDTDDLVIQEAVLPSTLAPGLR